MEKTGKEFLVNILRSAFITKEDASILYDTIHDKCVEALCEGKEVNLFDLAAIREHVTPSHERYALGDRRITVPDKSKIKARVFPKLKSEWEFLNDD